MTSPSFSSSLPLLLSPSSSSPLLFPLLHPLQATGIRLGTLLQLLFGFVAAVIIAFTASWELSFLMLLAFPILGTVAFFQIRLLVGRAQKNKKRLEKSGQTAVESIDNIRTVEGLGIEGKFLDRYNGLLAGPFRYCSHDNIDGDGVVFNTFAGIMLRVSSFKH